MRLDRHRRVLLTRLIERLVVERMLLLVGAHAGTRAAGAGPSAADDFVLPGAEGNCSDANSNASTGALVVQAYARALCACMLCLRRESVPLVRELRAEVLFRFRELVEGFCSSS